MATLEQLFANQAQPSQENPFELQNEQPANPPKVTETPLNLDLEAPGFAFTTIQALKSPSKSGAWLREKFDQAGGLGLLDESDDHKVYTKEELQSMHPDAPEGLFKHSNTKRFADYIIERNKYNKGLEVLKKLNSEDSILPDFGRDLWYGAVQNIGPTDIVAGAAITAALTSAAATMGIATTALLATPLQMATFGAVDGMLNGTFSYLLEKQLESKTQEEADPMQIPIGAAFGFGLGYAGAALKNFFNRSGKGAKGAVNSEADNFFKTGSFNTAEAEVTRIPKPTTWVEINIPVQIEDKRWIKVEDLSPVTGLIEAPKTVDLNAVPEGAITPLGKLKYKVYSGARYFQNDVEPGRWFAIFNQDSPRAHNGAEIPFGQSTYLTDSSGPLRSYSASVNQGGELVEILTRSSNIAIADLNNPELLGTVTQIVKEFSDTFETKLPEYLDGQNLINFINTQPHADIIQNEIIEALKSEGFDGLSFSTTEKILDDTFKNNHLFMFDGIADIDKYSVDTLDGTLGFLPEGVSYQSELAKNLPSQLRLEWKPDTTTKSYKIKYGEGLLRNGTKVHLDPLGSIKSDPFYDASYQSYVEYFSKHQIDVIDKAIQENDIVNIKKNFPQIQKNMIEHLNNLKIYQEFVTEADRVKMVEESFKNLNTFINLPEKERLNLYKQITDKLQDRQMLDQKFLEMKKLADLSDEAKAIADANYAQFDQLYKEDMAKKIANKTVEQMAKEGKAASIVEKANVYEQAKTLIDKIEKRKGTPKENQIGPLIEQYNSQIERLAKEDMNLYDEVMKAADFCLRRAST